MNRRDFLVAGSGLALGAAGVSKLWPETLNQHWSTSPTSSIIPVVGDGEWISNKPPEDSPGYYEPRSFDVSIGIELEGEGSANRVRATTPIPVECPEQKIESLRLESNGCQAGVRQVAPHASQLGLEAPAIQKGQKISAVAHMRLTIQKQYHGYEAAQFPSEQSPPSEVRKLYLQNSPGIETSSSLVKKLAAELTSGVDHPLDQAQRFCEWSRENIEARIGPYTSVEQALQNRVGDCEERSATVVALCRAVGIPARLVWVPNHNWMEFYLTDTDGKGHWIPAHAAAYSWFGWVGAHELVLQKGDRIQVPEQRRQFRLLEDWMQWGGRQPQVRYTAELTPLPPESGGDAGPGARRKDERGEWKLLGTHEADRYLRR